MILERVPLAEHSEEDTVKLTAIVAFVGVMICAAPAFAQREEIPKSIAESVGGMLRWTEGQSLGLAEAMPEEKYSFIPSGGNFKGVRTFAEQVKHVACAQFAFFNEIEGKTPPEHCEKGGPDKAKTKAELLKYLRDSFEYGNKVWQLSTRKMPWSVWKGPTPGQTRSWELQWPRCGTSPTTTASSWPTCA